MKRFGLMLAAVLIGMLTTGVSSADDACEGATVVEAGGVYVVVDDPENPHGGVWIYREANEQEGLQRNDDSCAGDENSDFIIF